DVPPAGAQPEVDRGGVHDHAVPNRDRTDEPGQYVRAPALSVLIGQLDALQALAFGEQCGDDASDEAGHQALRAQTRQPRLVTSSGVVTFLIAGSTWLRAYSCTAAWSGRWVRGASHVSTSTSPNTAPTTAGASSASNVVAGHSSTSSGESNRLVVHVTKVPPGRRTRRASRIARAGSGRWDSTQRQTTAAK